MFNIARRTWVNTAHRMKTQRNLQMGKICSLTLYVVSPVPDWVSHLYASLQRNLFSHARIRVHRREDSGWNGVRPAGHDTLERIGQTREPVFDGDLVRQIYRRPSKESWFWARLWETRLSSMRISTRRWLNSVRCWNGFPLSRICNHLG